MPFGTRPRLANAPDPLRELLALPALAGVAPRQVLRDLPERLVLEIRWQDRAAYLKLFRHAGAADTVRAAEIKLQAAAQALGQGADAVALVLLALPEHGVLITAPAPGRPLAQVLAGAADAPRAALIARTGQWLARLAAPTRARGTFGPRYWLRGLDQRLAATPGDWLDRPLVAAHLARMQTEALPLRGAPVERAALHGDLTPDNLFLDAPAFPDLTGARMTGIDMQGGAEMAVARDMARLLVWLESRREAAPAACRDGIDAQDHQALTGVPGLLAADQAAILRFQIGELLLAYYLDSARQPRRRRALARAMRAWALTPAP